jgi:hypothetical protein
MNVCKRILAGLTLLVSAAMLLLGLAGGVGVWIVKGPVTDKATPVFERIDAALDVAERSLDLARDNPTTGRPTWPAAPCTPLPAHHWQQ